MKVNGNNLEFIPGYGYRNADGSRAFQESHMRLDGTPKGYLHPALYDTKSLHVESTAEGFWVMDGMGSYHNLPFQRKISANKYLDLLKEATQ